MSRYAQQLQALHQAMVRRETSPMLEHIIPARAAGFPAKARLAVYVDGYATRLIDTTLADYPALAHYMGAGPCRALVEAFVAATPSPHWDLNRYPVAFANYVAQHEPNAAAHAIAALESAIASVFWLPESAPLMPEALAALPEEAFAAQHFRLRTASHLLSLDYAAHEYLTAFRQGAAPDMIHKIPHYLLVIRHHNEVRREVLEQAEYELLHGLAHGLCFVQAVSSISNQERLAEKLPNYIARWFAGGFLQNNAV